MGVNHMTKIALVTDDEQTISAHFGRAAKIVIITLQDGEEVAREIKLRASNTIHIHDEHDEHDHDHHDHSHEHDHGHHHHDHTSKFIPMEGCDILIARGMGSPAIQHAHNMGLQVYLTKLHGIDEAITAYNAGELDHDERRIHRH